MANINIKFNNKDYLLSCDDGQEENLKELASHLDAKYSELKKNLGNIGENKLLLITAIQMVDDYFDLFQKVKSAKDDFEKLSKSVGFKSYFKISSLKYLKNDIRTFVKKSGPSFLEVRIKSRSMKNLDRPKKFLEIKKKFMR